MLSRLFPFLDPALIDPDLPATLRRLAVDLEALRHVPVSVAALRGAPLITRWAAMLTPAGVRLIGEVSDHPRFGDREVITSPLWAADPEGLWVRTTSRFYRLGQPVDGEVRSVLRSVFEAYADDTAYADDNGDDDTTERRS
jgi:hypothetical protein